MVTGAREGTDADAILGVVPRLVLEPSSAAEAAEALRRVRARPAARSPSWAAGPSSELGTPRPRPWTWSCAPPGSPASSSTLPADQIAVVEAGLPLGALQARLAGARPAAGPRPAAPGARDDGGVVAANAFGPRRLASVPPRDLVVGMTLVRADGKVAKGGGKVVKNVAGFDLPTPAGRLAVGTLALIATITVRLHPLPEAEATVLVTGALAGRVRGRWWRR